MTSLLVTVFSDASIRGNTVGCGYWFKSAATSNTGSANMEANTPPNSNEAELWGMLQAMTATKAAHSEDIDVVIQCDNIAALAALVNHGARFAKGSKLKAPKRKKLTPFEQSCLSRIMTIRGIGRIWLKHVKGHSSGCSRTFVNNLTDRLAGRASANQQENAGSDAPGATEKP